MTDRIENNFHKVLVAAARTREIHRKNLNSGIRPRQKELIEALNEVEQGKITYKDVKELK